MEENRPITPKTPSNWKWFKMEEFLKSETAERLGFWNVPLQEHVENMDKLVTNLLDRLREYWGSPIRITSGYRVPGLNEAVGGVKNSQHIEGKAADIQPIGRSFDDFTAFLVEWLKGKNFDQCIIEKKGTSRWIHISYDEKRNRRKIFSLNK